MANDETQNMEETRMDAEAPAAPSDVKAPMKFSLSVTKSSSSARPPLFPTADRPKYADANKVEYVSVFDGKSRDPTQASVKVIPLPEKSWRPEKRMKNIMIATENLPSTDEMFEVETLPAGAQPSVQYGLQLKNKPADTAEMTPEVAVDRDLQRYRDDIALLPDEMSVDDYDNIPVEEFGEALLRGMGWEKDKPIGRNTTTVAEPVVPVRRMGREGLGAIPAPQPEMVKKFIKPGEIRKTKLTVGRIMCVIAGVHAGSRGQIAEISGNSYMVALLDSGKRVRMKEDELAEVGSPEEEKAIKKLAELHIERENSSAKGSKRSSDEGRRKYHTGREARRDGRSTSDAREVSEQRKSDEDSRRSQRKDGRSSSRDEADNGNHRHRSRKDSSEKGYGHERGVQDGSDESRHWKHKSGREDGNDGKEHYEAAPSRESQDREEKNSRLVSREEKIAHDRKSEKDSRSDLRELSSEVYYKEKIMPSGKENFGDKRVESWLARDIRVRIVDKRAYGDKFYLQKACVVDVVSLLLCDIKMDDGGRIIEKVKQEHLETALPRQGGRVLVVSGKYRGHIGRLQKRDSERGIGLVQLEDDYDVLSFDLDHLAEFVGVQH